MMKRKSRSSEDFSIAFLDIICCGFGAIVLLLMITKTMEPVVLEEATVQLDGQIKKLQEQLFTIRGETTIFNRYLNAKHEQIDAEKKRIAILRTRHALIEAQYAQIAKAASISEKEKGDLAIALQSLSVEMERLLGKNYKSTNNLIGGIPVDSEYLIFIIDTSGSMFNYAWPKLLEEVIAILNI